MNIYTPRHILAVARMWYLHTSCTFLPKFLNILLFFAFSEKSHTCPYFLELALHIENILKSLILDFKSNENSLKLKDHLEKVLPVLRYLGY